MHVCEQFVVDEKRPFMASCFGFNRHVFSCTASIVILEMSHGRFERGHTQYSNGDVPAMISSKMLHNYDGHRFSRKMLRKSLRPHSLLSPQESLPFVLSVLSFAHDRKQEPGDPHV